MGCRELTIGDMVTRTEKYRYLGSILEDRGNIDEDINQRIRVGWQKWRNALRILCDKKIPVELKGKVYHIVVKPVVLYGSECLPIKKTQVQKLIVAKMRII
uniref:RNA-directed DNA polymerase n=1 Tax=Opuntia streptacantha TaxID=393608 RepID=A0A7C8Z989_OPUST